MLSLEMVLVTPVVLLVLAVITQFAWIGFQTACFDYSVNTAGWMVDIDDAQASNANATLKEIIEKSWTPLDGNKLTVNNARIETSRQEETSPASGPHDKDIYLVERTTRTTTTIHVEADVSYTIPTLVDIPLFRDISLMRHLSRDFISDAQFEVS